MNRRVWMALGVLAVVAGCGGGGGGGGGGGTAAAPPATSPVSGNAPAPSSGPGDTMAYFPLSAGDSWVYDASPSGLGSVGSAFVTAHVVGPHSIGGVSTTDVAFQASSSTTSILDEYWASTGGGVTFYGDNLASDVVTNAVVPHADLLFPVQIGHVSSLSATAIPAGTASNGDALTTSFNQTIDVLALETATVDAGVFPNAARVVLTDTGTVTDTVTKQSAPFTTTETLWLAPGVGIVKDLQTLDANGTISTVSTKVLRGYTSGGVMHGLDVPYTLKPALGTGSVQPCGPVVSAGSATTVLTVVALYQGASPNCTLTGWLSDISGNLVATVNIGIGVNPLVAFDGSNFEVAYAVEAVPAAGQWLVERISPAGVQVDPAPGYVAVASTTEYDGGTGAIAVGGGGVMLVYGAGTPTSSGLRAVLLNPAGSVTAGPLALTTGATYPVDPSLGFDGTNFLLTWFDNGLPTGTNDIFATRVSGAGVVIDLSPILITTHLATQSGLYPPSVAFDGTNYLVVWLDARSVTGPADNNRQIYGARVSPAGVLVDGPADTGGILISGTTAQPRNYPVVSFDGNEYLIAWASGLGLSPPIGTNINGVRMTPSAVFPSGVGYEIGFSGIPPNGLYFSYPSIAAASGFSVISWLHDDFLGTTSLEATTARPF